MSKTCTAPGHPTCTITCDRGCIAIYYEDTGKCVTACSTSVELIELSEGSRLSITIQDLEAKDVARLLGSSFDHALRTLLNDCLNPVSLTLQSATVEEICENLKKIVV